MRRSKSFFTICRYSNSFWLPLFFPSDENNLQFPHMGCIACGSTLQEDSFTIWTFDSSSTSLNPYVFKTIETDNGDFLPKAKRRNTGTKSNGVVKLVTLIVSFLICLQGSMYHRGSPCGCYWSFGGRGPSLA